MKKGDMNNIKNRSINQNLFKGALISLAFGLLSGQVLAEGQSSKVSAQSLEKIGKWGEVLDWSKIVASHMVQLRTGEVLVLDRTATNNYLGANPDRRTIPQVWNPETHQFRNTFGTPDEYELFCTGLSALPDGTILAAGGGGVVPAGPKTYTFDPHTITWTEQQEMKRPRWYPTLTTLSNGNILATHGLIVSALKDANTPEIFDKETQQWRLMADTAKRGFEETYPAMFVLPDGNILQATPGSATAILDMETETWSEVSDENGPIEDALFAVMYDNGKVMRTDGKKIETFDYYENPKQWKLSEHEALTPDRVKNFNLVVLPNGKVMMNGGGKRVLCDDGASNDDSIINQKKQEIGMDGVKRLVGEMKDKGKDDIKQAGSKVKGRVEDEVEDRGLAKSDMCRVNHSKEGVWETEIWDPNGGQWTLAAPENQHRLYHSASLLLADGRVLSAGGDGGSYYPDQYTAQIFSPPYLFEGNQLAQRPDIERTVASAHYNSEFIAKVGETDSITSVVFMKPGAVTHWHDFEQRRISLKFKQQGDELTILAPDNGNLAPPGIYMMFVINDKGVPSTAKFIKIRKLKKREKMIHMMH